MSQSVSLDAVMNFGARQSIDWPPTDSLTHHSTLPPHRSISRSLSLSFTLTVHRSNAHSISRVRSHPVTERMLRFESKTAVVVGNSQTPTIALRSLNDVLRFPTPSVRSCPVHALKQSVSWIVTQSVVSLCVHTVK